MVRSVAGDLPEQVKNNQSVNLAAGNGGQKMSQYSWFTVYVKFNFQLDPYEKDILFLFCGRRNDRIKGLVWEGDGFRLLYKRLELGGFSWPRTKEEALEITPEQFQALMKGLEIVSRHPIQEVHPQDLL